MTDKDFEDTLEALRKVRDEIGHSREKGQGERLYPTAAFRRKTYIQISVRNPANIQGVFRVPDRRFSERPQLKSKTLRPGYAYLA